MGTVEDVVVLLLEVCNPRPNAGTVVVVLLDFSGTGFAAVIEELKENPPLGGEAAFPPSPEAVGDVAPVPPNENPELVPLLASGKAELDDGDPNK